MAGNYENGKITRLTALDGLRFYASLVIVASHTHSLGLAGQGGGDGCIFLCA